MRLIFKFVRSAEAEDLPVTYSWLGGPPDEWTRDETEMILLFEIAESLKALEYSRK